MSPPAPADEPAAVEPLPALIGLADWPHLRMGFFVEQGTAPGEVQLVVAMSFVPPPPKPKPTGVVGEVPSNPDPVTTDLERYRTICGQWEAEVEVALAVSFCADLIPPVGASSPGAILRQNALAILDALEKPDGPEGDRLVELARLVFALPDPGAAPESYPARVLQPLTVTLHCRRPASDKPDSADPKPDATKPNEAASGGDIAPAATAAESSISSASSPVIDTPVPPQTDAGGSPSPRTYVDFATSFEAAYASLCWRVLMEDASPAGGAGFFLLSWQGKDGLEFSLSEAAAPVAAGFACPLISPVGHARENINGALLPADFPARYARAESLTVRDFDLDAALARLLEEVEAFLAPERRGSVALVAPTLVERCVAAKETLAGLLGERVVPLGPIEAESLAAKAARAAMRAACHDDLRNFNRIGAVAMLQLDVTAPQSMVVHGRFVPDAASSVEVLAGASRLAETRNALAFPILAEAAERGNEARLTGTFHCEAIELVDASLATDGQAGRRLCFVGEGDTRVSAPPLRARLPVRTMPRPPDLLGQVFAAQEGDGVTAAKSWRLECDYACEILAQDTLRFGVVFNSSADGPAVPGPRAATLQRPDLLDVLVIFQTTLSAIREVLDRGLRPSDAAPAASPDPMIEEAVRAFVMLVEAAARHFTVPEREADDGFVGWGERQDLTPPPGRPIMAGPFDITLRQHARCALQVVRNLTTGLPPAFHYPTGIVSAGEGTHAFIDRELGLDIAKLPPLEYYLPDGPAPGSLVDGLTRLLRAAISVPVPPEEAKALSVGLRVDFSARLAGTGAEGLEVRVPVTPRVHKQISAARRLLEMRAWALAVAAHLEAWLAQADPRRSGNLEPTGARFVFDLMIDAAGTSGTAGRPWLRWRELYFRCADAV